MRTERDAAVAGDHGNLSVRSRRLVLLGGGHAHLEVLRRFAERPLPDADVTLITPHRRHRYSSSMPAVLRGQLPDEPESFALDVLAQRAGVHLLLGTVDAIEGGSTPRVRVQDEWLDADLLSLDIGSAPSMAHVAGAALHAHHVRSYAAWRALRAATEALFADRDVRGVPMPKEVAARVVVVGAGAGGVEMALAFAGRARRTKVPVQVMLVEAEQQLPARSGGRTTLQRLLDRAGVQCVYGARVVGVTADTVQLDGGAEVASALTVWVAGAAAPAALQASNALPLTRDGFLRVTSLLQAVDGTPVFGAGDCVAIDGHPLDKAGVFAVRQAPVLAHNLRAAIVAQLGGAMALRPYRPQQRYLSILDTSDGQALLTWGGRAVHSRWALSLKRWLDARFVARYRSSTEASAVTAQLDATRRARVRNIGSAFVAGAAMVLAIHQPLVWFAHRWLATPWIAFSTTPTRPFGAPAFLSAMVWGGLWVALLSPWWRVTHREEGRTAPAAGSVSTRAAAISCALLPTAVGAALMSFSPTFPPLGAHPWRAIVAAVVINGVWGFGSGAFLNVWRARRSPGSRPPA